MAAQTSVRGRKPQHEPFAVFVDDWAVRNWVLPTISPSLDVAVERIRGRNTPGRPATDRVALECGAAFVELLKDDLRTTRSERGWYDWAMKHVRRSCPKQKEAAIVVPRRATKYLRNFLELLHQWAVLLVSKEVEVVYRDQVGLALRLRKEALAMRMVRFNSIIGHMHPLSAVQALRESDAGRRFSSAAVRDPEDGSWKYVYIGGPASLINHHCAKHCTVKLHIDSLPEENKWKALGHFVEPLQFPSDCMLLGGAYASGKDKEIVAVRKLVSFCCSLGPEDKAA